jgi:SAM-dependent methyltransferase
MQDSRYRGTELQLFQYARNWKGYFGKFIKPYLHGDVLEVGAGIGETTKLLCDGTQSSWCCLEPDKEFAATIHYKVVNGYLPKCCEVKNGYSSDLRGMRTFDVVVYIDVLEHISDDKEEIIIARELVKSGGYIIVLVPAHQWLYNSFDKTIGHRRRYSEKQLQAIFPDGMKNKMLKHLDSVGLLASLGNTILLKKGRPSKSQILFWDRLLVPLSIIVDRFLGFFLGKSILGVWLISKP